LSGRIPRPAAGSATLLSRISPGLKLPPAYTYYFVAATPSNGIKKTDVTRRLLFDYIHCILCPLLLLYRRGRIVPFELFTYRKAFAERVDCQKSPVQPTCADGRDTYREIER